VVPLAVALLLSLALPRPHRPPLGLSFTPPYTLPLALLLALPFALPFATPLFHPFALPLALRLALLRPLHTLSIGSIRSQSAICD